MAKRIDFPVTRAELAANLGTCRSCGARIVWKDRKPLHDETKEWREGRYWLESHFARCPDADKWRKPAAVKEAMREVATEPEAAEERADG